MTTALATKTVAESLEKVLIGGDLKALSPDERVMYYKQTCESLGLNPLTKPFEYITLNGKLTLYARKDCTDQLRQIHGVSVDAPDVQEVGNLIIVKVSAIDKSGRRDSDVGVVTKGDMRNAANEIMKAVTKAKRRVTLSICGLGMLDETEVETIPNAAVGEPEPKQIGSRNDPQAPIASQPKHGNFPGDDTQDEAELSELLLAIEERLADTTGGDEEAVNQILKGRVIAKLDLKAAEKLWKEIS